jgi:hypothetical protein
MNIKKLAIVVGALALVAASGIGGVLAASKVYAQPATPQAQATPGSRQGDLGFAFGGGNSWKDFDAEAEALNLTPTQLFEQLHSGKSLSDIASAQGIELQKVQDAVAAVHTQAMKDNISQAVKDGKMTQDQADWLLQGIEKGYTTGGLDFGRGTGMVGHGMPGGDFGTPSDGISPLPTPQP